MAMFGWIGKRLGLPKLDSTPASQTTQSGTSYDKSIIDMANATARHGMRAFDQPFQSGHTRTGSNMLNQMGSGRFSMADAQPYMNMYRQNAMHGVDQLNRTLGNTRSDIMDQQGFGGTGSGNVLAQMLATEASGRQQADLLSNAGIQGLNFASNRFNQDFANQSGLAMQHLALGDAERNHYFNQAQQMANILGTIPKNVQGHETTTVNPAKPNDFVQTLGTIAKIAGFIGRSAAGMPSAPPIT